MYICILCIYVYMYVCMYICIYVYMYICIYVYVYMCIYVYVYMCICVYVFIYILYMPKMTSRYVPIPSNVSNVKQGFINHKHLVL